MRFPLRRPDGDSTPLSYFLTVAPNDKKAFDYALNAQDVSVTRFIKQLDEMMKPGRAGLLASPNDPLCAPVQSMSQQVASAREPFQSAPAHLVCHPQHVCYPHCLTALCALCAPALYRLFLPFH